MDQCKNQIEEARVMLEKKIPEEAELAQSKARMDKIVKKFHRDLKKYLLSKNDSKNC